MPDTTPSSTAFACWRAIPGEGAGVKRSVIDRSQTLSTTRTARIGSEMIRPPSVRALPRDRNGFRRGFRARAGPVYGLLFR